MKQRKHSGALQSGVERKPGLVALFLAERHRFLLRQHQTLANVRSVSAISSKSHLLPTSVSCLNRPGLLAQTLTLVNGDRVANNR